MGRHSDRARETLLNSAEELFALHGIDAVSNRAIAEHAGTANHSAVTYHFGGREGLMRALLSRGRSEMAVRRAELLGPRPGRPALREIVTGHILPWTEHLASLPVPSWRARFLYQVASVPSGAEALRESTAQSMRLEEILPADLPELREVSPNVLSSRARILGGMVMGICASYEGQLEQGEARGTWLSVGYFLVDAAVGLLAAPVTHPTEFVTRGSPPAFPL